MLHTNPPGMCASIYLIGQTALLDDVTFGSRGKAKVCLTMTSVRGPGLWFLWDVTSEADFVFFLMFCVRWLFKAVVFPAKMYRWIMPFKLQMIDKYTALHTIYLTALVTFNTVIFHLQFFLWFGNWMFVSVINETVKYLLIAWIKNSIHLGTNLMWPVGVPFSWTRYLMYLMISVMSLCRVHVS